MNEVQRCTTCGNVLSGTLSGQCPACLLKAGLAGSPDEHALTTVVFEQPPAEVHVQRPTSMPGPGQQFGEYHIVRALGQGGMGSVFEAEEHHTGRRLALKVLNHSLDSPVARERFLREGKLASRIKHPQTVFVLGAEEIHGAPVITMELVKGGTLQDRVRQHGPMPIQEAVDAILQVIEGLEAAQAYDVLHRDVKPANCFVDAEGRVKIGDFGLSIDKVGRGDLNLTSSGVFLGTPTFASPEQLRGDELDARSDQYAVGVTLYYLLTGAVPFQAATMVQLVAKVLDRPAPDVRTLRPEVSRELAGIIQRCLAKEPGRRFRTYADLRTALLPFSSLLPAPASPVRRFAADCIDKVATAAINASISFGFTLAGASIAFDQPLNPMMWVLGLVLFVLYYALPEGLLGVTLGKKLLGLRVVRDGTRQPPGLWRATLRTFVFQYVPVAPFLLFVLAFPDVLQQDGLKNLTGSTMNWFMMAAGGFYVVLGLLFVTMRRRNGFAAVHDLITGCRVVDRPTASQRPVLKTVVETTETPAPGAMQVGPYHVLGTLGRTSTGEWHVGYDPRLFRKVWLCVVPEGTPMVTPARQNVGRPGRLRWLAGRRGPQGNWDAFDAPTGQALSQLLDRRHDWAHVRYWLIDLADELAAALKDGTIPPTLSLDHVWLTAEGRALLLDHEVPGLHRNHEDPAARLGFQTHSPYAFAPIGVHPGDVEPTKGFLHQVALATLQGTRVSPEQEFAVPLPLHVRPIVEGLEKIQRPEVASAQIQAVLSKPTRVSRLRRALVIAGCLCFPLFVVLTLFVQIVVARLSPAVPDEVKDLRNALHWYSPVFDFAKPNDAEAKALEVYLAAVQRERINDPQTWTHPHMLGALPHHQKVVKDLMARMPAPTDEQLQEAMTVVEPKLKRERTSGLEHQRLDVLGPVLFITSLVLFAAWPSIFCALAFGGGVFWRLLSIAAVTRDGRPAGRLRLLWRSLVAWSPLFIGLFLLALAAPLMDDVTIVVAILALAYAGIVLASALRHERGWPDCLAGTWPVIR